MKLVKVTLMVAALSVLGGCAVVPVGPGYDTGYYYSPAPAYYPPPVYYGPSFGVQIYGGRHWGHHGHRGHRYR